MSNVEKKDFKRKKLPDEFVSALEFQKREAEYHRRDRTLEELLTEGAIQSLPGLKKELENLPEDKPVKILDFGCGKGIAVKELQENHPNWEIHGIDLLPPKKKEKGKGKIIRGEASHLPYKSNQFDLVYSKFAYPYFPDKIKATAEALRVTKAGGVILIGTEEGDAYELVKDEGVRGKVFKRIDINKELYDMGIKGVSKENIGDEFTIRIYIHKSKGDDELVKLLPFKFLRAIADASARHPFRPTPHPECVDSFYKRVSLDK